MNSDVETNASVATKSDQELREDIERELDSDPSVDARDIAVNVKNGIVTLTGFVRNFNQKWAVERSIKRVAGVTAIADEIEVKLEFERTDVDIAEEAALALKLDTRVPLGRIKVTVSHCWITLEGSVDFYFQKDAAESVVRNLAGIRGVTNLIVVDAPPTISPEEIQKRIEEAFKRSALIDAKQITVEVQDRKVTLKGAVRSWAERNEAEMAAWATPGVSEVENRLEVKR
jgi:osmotically-inducible protein OsmY